MAPRATDGVIVVLDIGRNVSQSDEKGQKSFFTEAKECVSRLIERKIMSQTKTLLSIILVGSKKTKNDVSEEGETFRHIEVVVEPQEPTWEMIRKLPEMPSKYRGDWMEALIVSADLLKNGISGTKLSSKKIILFTNFMSHTSLETKEIDAVINGFKEENFELDVIGIDVADNSLKGEDIQLARKFVEETNGATASFEDAMRYLLFHKKKSVASYPWNIDFSIGPNIKIPVSVYVRLRDEPAVKSWRKAVKDPVTLAASTTEGIIRNKVHINTENQTTVDSGTVISGYHYGQKIIPFTESDKTFLYKSGEKSLSIYGFTHTSNVTWQNLCGDGLFYAFGKKGDKKAQHALRCLVECLHEMNLIGLVRRVYFNGSAPKMFALMPVIDNDNFVCLSMAEICYADDVKYMTFPTTNIKQYACTDEQVDAFKELIHAMDLTKAYDETFDDTEAFPIAETVSPAVQYVLDCITFRAMNPGKPLPSPRDDIMMLFNIPPIVEKRSKEPLDKLKKLFTLTKIEKKTRNKKVYNDPEHVLKQNGNTTLPSGQATEEIPIVKLPVTNKNIITKIGTADPISDYKLLIENGKILADLSTEMTASIENLVYCNFDGVYSKAMSVIKFFREECVKADPTPYNNWMLKLKKELIARKKQDIMELINSNQLDYILKEENNSSIYENLESCESQLYDNDTVPDATELTMDEEINDLFDDM